MRNQIKKKKTKNFLKTLATPNYMRWDLKLKLQYFGHLMWRADLLEKTLMLGKTDGKRGQQRMRYLDSITGSMDINVRKLRQIVVDRNLECCSPWGWKELDINEWLNNERFEGWRSEREGRLAEGMVTFLSLISAPHFTWRCLFILRLHWAKGKKPSQEKLTHVVELLWSQSAGAIIRVYYLSMKRDLNK